MTEETLERALDLRVQRRIATDAAYRNAENAEEQADRELEIEEEELAALERERGLAYCNAGHPAHVAAHGCGPCNDERLARGDYR